MLDSVPDTEPVAKSVAESEIVADETALVDAESDVRAVIDGMTVTVRLVEAHAVPH